MILVTGATGNVGRHVVSGLLDAGARVRALTRNPQSAGLPSEVDVVGGDLSSPHDLNGSLEEVDAVFLLWRLMTADTAPRFLESVSKRARRIVFLSSSAVRDDVEQQSTAIGKVHADIENLIEKSGLQWTFLRPGGFASNALWWRAAQFRAGDAVRWPYGAAAMAPIHERDIAAVAVRALTEEGHGKAKYVLTGPQSISQIEQVGAIAEATGRPLRFEEISPETAREQIGPLMPASITEMLRNTLAKLVTQPAPVTTTVTDITGFPARSFREWALDHAADFRLAQANRVGPA